MKCQECNERPASLHFTKIVNGEKTEFHICEQCAKEKGEYNPNSNSFSIHQLLSGLLNFEHAVQDTNKRVAKPEMCPKCNMSYEQFVRLGRFGCAHCYETFKPKLEPVLKRVHGGNHTHGGKIPKRIGGSIEIRKKIAELKEELKEQVAKEEFENAALIRDKIRSLEQSIRDKEEG
ncbi:UvrB/UvrC motif-containing protein [Alkalihalobacillus sp. LMS39]|uniref:UvrB/UvrC motif-containing protein n=1 Tax=Alkalihalobacillus sp. LMS39 TaxID=2924032 RepID=UPI001FB1CB84|nr:UvrB/UvrC motif-containing protein [Alkalihalobacillus sp. LMS39]UOE94221.1 UvrB/UvrC motif-containing protein [Alkalihalobacillus sp. LMS39]